MFSNEDVTIGSWMLAMNVDHEHDHALCETECTSSFIAVWDIPKCSGWYCWSPFSFFFFLEDLLSAIFFAFHPNSYVLHF